MLNNVVRANRLTVAHRIVLRVTPLALGRAFFLMARWFDWASRFSKLGNLALLFRKLGLQGGDLALQLLVSGEQCRIISTQYRVFPAQGGIALTQGMQFG